MNSLASLFIVAYRAIAYPVYRLLGLDQICKLRPSCSHFAEEAFSRHGFIKTCVMVAARLYRCGRTMQGENPVPDAPYVLSAQEKRDGPISLFAMLISGLAARRLIRGSRAR